MDEMLISSAVTQVQRNCGLNQFSKRTGDRPITLQFLSIYHNNSQLLNRPDSHPKFFQLLGKAVENKS